MCDGLDVTMTTYLSLGVVEYLWHVRWIGRYHDYILEFGSSGVFMACTIDWPLP